MKERGQSLVELAISLVVLLFLLSGVVEFGISFFQFIQLRDAVQEGALYGSIHPCPSDYQDIITRVRGASDTPLDLNDVAVTVEETADGGIKVSAFYDHKIFMPFIPKLIGDNYIHLYADVTDTILIRKCE